MKLRLVCALLAASTLLCGCSIMERSYSAVEMHSETYWENPAEDTLRAESYQDLVNALLLLVSAHADDGTVRVYGLDAGEWDGMAASACSEVQQTDVGSYLLRYMTYRVAEEKDCFAIHARFSYRRSAAEFASLISATSEEAVPDLLREALQEGADALAVRLSYFPEDEDAFARDIERLRRELDIEQEWTLTFYPGLEEGGIIEILLI